MCGITGLFSFKPIKDVDGTIRQLKNTLLKLQERGDDATGIAVINSVTNKFEVFKKPVSAKEFIKDKKFIETIKNFGEFNIILGHTRTETQGTKVDNKNNHPFYHRDTGSILIHNGTLWDYEGTKRQYGLKTDGDCDSEIILSMYDKFLDIKKALKRIHGNFAIALYHNKKLWLYRDSNPLIIATDTNVSDDKVFYFASKEEYVNNIFERKEGFYDIFTIRTKDEPYVLREFEKEELLEIDFEKNKLKITNEVKNGEIEIRDKFKKDTTVNTQYNGGYYNGNNGCFNAGKSYKGSSYTRSNNLEALAKTHQKELTDDKFEGFIQQVVSTTKRMNQEQTEKLMATVEAIVMKDFDYDYLNDIEVDKLIGKQKEQEAIEGKLIGGVLYDN